MENSKFNRIRQTPVKHKKELAHLETLIASHGYWSEEVKEYNSTLAYHIMTYINLRVSKYK